MRQVALAGGRALSYADTASILAAGHYLLRRRGLTDLGTLPAVEPADLVAALQDPALAEEAVACTNLVVTGRLGLAEVSPLARSTAQALATLVPMAPPGPRRVWLNWPSASTRPPSSTRSVCWRGCSLSPPGWPAMCMKLRPRAMKAVRSVTPAGAMDHSSPSRLVPR